MSQASRERGERRQINAGGPPHEPRMSLRSRCALLSVVRSYPVGRSPPQAAASWSCIIPIISLRLAVSPPVVQTPGHTRNIRNTSGTTAVRLPSANNCPVSPVTLNSLRSTCYCSRAYAVLPNHPATTRTDLSTNSPPRPVRLLGFRGHLTHSTHYRPFLATRLCSRIHTHQHAVMVMIWPDPIQ